MNGGELQTPELSQQPQNFEDIVAQVTANPTVVETPADPYAPTDPAVSELPFGVVASAINYDAQGRINFGIGWSVYRHLIGPYELIYAQLPEGRQAKFIIHEFVAGKGLVSRSTYRSTDGVVSRVYEQAPWAYNPLLKGPSFRRELDEAEAAELKALMTTPDHNLGLIEVYSALSPREQQLLKEDKLQRRKLEAEEKAVFDRLDEAQRVHITNPNDLIA